MIRPKLHGAAGRGFFRGKRLGENAMSVTKKALRTLQTRFPSLVDLKYRAQYLKRSVTRRPFERDFELFAKFHPEPDADFLDVGANRGQTVQALRLFKENPITCFEPSKYAFKRLERYTEGVERITLRNIGLGAAPSKVRLYTPIYRGYVFDGLASTVEAEARGWLSERTLMFFDEKDLRVSEEDIVIETLDAQGSRPAFIKIDVQGGELAVLQGGEQTIAEHRPILLIEAPKKEHEIAFLSRFGYRPYGFDGTVLRQDDTSRTNAFFISPERVGQLDLGIS
jgi:FkbM family methyltransferase